MKTVFCIAICVLVAINSFSQDDNRRTVKLMAQNKLKKFIRESGSEENAIHELMLFTLPDTFYNYNEAFIWERIMPRNIIQMDYYASRKLQSFYWILKIYNSDYKFKKGESFQFLDERQKPIYDFEDLDIEKKAYYYQVVITSPTTGKTTYFDKLGYIRSDNKSFKALEDLFRNWYEIMKKYGLGHMRKEKISPPSSLEVLLDNK